MKILSFRFTIRPGFFAAIIATLACLCVPALAEDIPGLPSAVSQSEQQPGDRGENGEALAELVELLKPLDRLAADFTQKIFSKNGSPMTTVPGKLKAERPGRFFWHTDAPSAQTLVTNGDRVWLYDPDLEQVTIQKVAEDLQATPALLFSGNVAEIDSNYSVRFVVDAEQDPQDFRMFELKPKAPESLFENLRISFLKGVPVALLIEDGLGQITVLELESVEINPELADSVFSFAIPEGVDVISDVEG